MSQRYKLTDDDTGVFKIRTASGAVHFLDLNRPTRTITRLPGEYAPESDEIGPLPTAELRRDGETIIILMVVKLVVGEGGRILDGRRPGRLDSDLPKDDAGRQH